MYRYMDKKYSFWIRFSFVILFALMFTRCTQKTYTTESEVSVNFNINDGKRLFLHYCSPCHGENASGAGRYFPTQIDPQPPDLTNPDYFEETNENVMFRAIKFGSKVLEKSVYSPAYGKTLTDEEIINIIEYLKFSRVRKENDVKK